MKHGNKHILRELLGAFGLNTNLKKPAIASKKDA